MIGSGKVEGKCGEGTVVTCLHIYIYMYRKGNNALKKNVECYDYT